MKKTKYMFSIYAGATPDSNNPDYWGGEIVWVTPADYKTSDKYIKSGSKSITRAGYDASNTTIVPAGSIIVSKRAPIGTVSIAEVPLCTNQGCLSCVPLQDVDSSFAYYALSIMDNEMEVLGAGTTFKEISANAFANMKIPYCSLPEQQAIVRYLDYKCSAIDEAIERHKKIIEKLEEHRKASAFNAVTKGISGSTLKSSGEEWLGDIPEHWSVQRNWTLFKEVNERGNDSLPILTVSINTGISDRELSDDESDRVFVRSADKSKYKRVQPGDIAYNMMRAWQGAFGTARVEGMVSPAYVTVRPIKEMDSRYYEYLMRSDSASQEFEKYSRGITDFRLRLYYPEFSNIKVCVPPLAEQKEIADYLDELYKKTDIAIARVHAIISKLEEYRKSIIYNAVTGEIDCRGYNQ